MQVMQTLIDLEALQPTGDLSSVCTIHNSNMNLQTIFVYGLSFFYFYIQVRRSIQFFLDNLLSQTPDQEQTLSAIGEVCKHSI